MKKKLNKACVIVLLFFAKTLFCSNVIFAATQTQAKTNTPLNPATTSSTSASTVAGANVFANGADVGWLSQMEASGRKFYNSSGVQQDCLQILKDLCVNSIRLRVWVNPSNGYCGKADVVAMAVRAHNMGFRIMIDFHYSDSWADPGQQNKPAAWTGYTFPQLVQAVYDHTYDVLSALDAAGVTPEWVQVGNETNNGMLWDTTAAISGRASDSMSNYAQLEASGYDAVKAVNPDIKVIVHISNGYDNTLFRWIFDGLKNNGGKWDVIGMSLYPDATNLYTTWDPQCLANMNDMATRYPGKEVMISEFGYDVTQAQTTHDFAVDLMNKVKSVPNNKGLGVFYWEPECYNGWQGYGKGAFDNTGKPTLAMNAFAENCVAVTVTPVNTATKAATITATPTYSRTYTGTFTRTPTPSLTQTNTATTLFTRTITATSTNTCSCLNSPTMTPTVTPSRTSSATFTATFTRTLPPTFSATATFTQTVSPSPTNTITLSYTISSTASATPTGTHPTATYTPTFTATSTGTRTVSPSATATTSSSATVVAATFTGTASFTRTVTAVNSPTNTPANTFTKTFTRTITPSLTSTASNTATITRSATPTCTRTSTEIPTVTATLTLTALPTATIGWGNKFDIPGVLPYPNPVYADHTDMKIKISITQPAHELKLRIYTVSFRRIMEVELGAAASKEITVVVPSSKLKRLSPGTYYIVAAGGSEDGANAVSKPQPIIILK